MKKQLFLDFDNVIVDTVKLYCNLYAELYHTHPEFIEPDPDKVWRYDMADECPLVEDKDAMFGDPLLYYNAPFYDQHAEQVVRYLTEYFDVIITSMGTWRNLVYKEAWIEKNLPFIKDIIYQRTDRYHGKETVNMCDAYFVDDNFLNLFCSNAAYKICFGRSGQWNEQSYGIHVRIEDWRTLKEALLQELISEQTRWMNVRR